MTTSFSFRFVELLRLLGGGMDNPELENLTIGSFMQRFGEDVDARSNDGKLKKKRSFLFCFRSTRRFLSSFRNKFDQ